MSFMQMLPSMEKLVGKEVKIASRDSGRTYRGKVVSIIISTSTNPLQFIELDGGVMLNLLHVISIETVG